MCGIAGFFNTKKKVIDEYYLKRFGQLLQHRGPDNFSYYYDNNVGLAHTRLSILDVSEHGNQPFKAGNNFLVYNGEIYNYLELQEKYLKNVKFSSKSDTEVLFHLLRKYDIKKVLQMIQGMFAFAFFDSVKEELILARDRVGIKPLFYHIKNDTICFASEVKAIKEFVNLNVDEGRILMSTFGIADKSRDFTLFKDLHHVSPGTYVKYSMEGKYEEKYFDFNDCIDKDLYSVLKEKPSFEVNHQFEETLEKSVQRMLMSDVPMGAFVSGGIDSSLISSIAMKYKDIRLFSADVKGKFSEIEDARSLSKQLGATLHEYSFEPNDLVDNLARCTWHLEVPLLVHANAIPFAGVAEVAYNNGVKPVLTGEGSDELFLGYPSLLARRYNSIIKGPFDLISSIYNKIPGLSNYIFHNSENKLYGTIELLTQKFTRQSLREETFECIQHVPEKERDDYYLSIQMMREGILALLWRNDRMGMLASIEARFPFLDENVIKLALNLPVKYKIGRINRFYNYKHPFLIDKKIVRKLSSKYLNNHLVYKRKNGFPVYGLRYLKIAKSFFKNGFVQNLLNLNESQLNYFVNNTDQYNLAKFFTLEIWALLFIKNENPHTVNELVKSSASVTC